MIVAMAQNGTIGKDNDLLFHLSGDLKRFKTITTGHTIIMGRKTLLSLPKWPLPNRRHIVISSDPNAEFEGCETVNSIEEAIAKVDGEEEAFVIGGGSIYEQFYPLSSKLYLTTVHQNFEGDTYFNIFNEDDWIVESREDLFDEKNNFNYSYINLSRKK
ncbi:dihydrofolate reductase [Mangrovibacterium diazotrophicum]|uniref:Dihydrofolate reductase n=2 Tax=Mangrovibacterium diazotrophicum TaxID=1261403 RepID=A0A419WB91_9BACT|nr:dihydrofolate reductase [Mangrovibacterium diazotrophicum]